MPATRTAVQALVARLGPRTPGDHGDVGTYKLIRYHEPAHTHAPEWTDAGPIGDDEWQLFDLDADPCEREDLTRSPEHAHLYRELHGRLRARSKEPETT